jgi:hypothetical protein
MADLALLERAAPARAVAADREAVVGQAADH